LTSYISALTHVGLLIEEQGRVVIRASIDDFQRPRAQRYRQGPQSPQGYYQDAFDYPSLQNALLRPLGPTGNGQYRRAVFDFSTDTALITREEHAPLNAILLVDGVFLLRPELDRLWDYRIFVQVDFEVALQRADVIVINNDPASPHLCFPSRTSG
jgi:uridine kinase